MEALDVDARPAEQLVWHRSLGYKLPSRRAAGSRASRCRRAASSRPRSSAGFTRGVTLVTPANSDVHRRAGRRHGCRATSAQLMEGVGSECLTYGGADFVEIDADDLQ